MSADTMSRGNKEETLEPIPITDNAASQCPSPREVVMTMGNNDRWLTVKETAERFGVSDKTIRRWIKDEKVHAEKHQGPYGEQWMIPESEVTTAQEITDVVQVENKIDIVALAKVLDKHLADKDDKTTLAIEQLQAQLAEMASVLEGIQVRQIASSED